MGSVRSRALVVAAAILAAALIGALSPHVARGQTVVPATATPTDTPTPTATPTKPAAPPLTFSVQDVKVGYGSADPQNARYHASVAKLKVDQTVKLLIYVAYTGITATLPAHLGFRIARGNSTVYLSSDDITISTQDNGGYTVYWIDYRPKVMGTFTFSGTAFVGSRHQHKSVSFTVVS